MLVYTIISKSKCVLWLLWLLFGAYAWGAEDPALTSVIVESASAAKYGPQNRRFQGIPGIARAPNGRLWATWYAGGEDEGPENYVVLATSGDDGRTWSDLRFVIDPPAEVRAYDPVLWLDPQGRLWWFHAQSYGWWDGRAGVWAVVTENPESEYPSWSSPRRIADGIMMNKPTVLKNGNWLLPVSIWNRKPPEGLSSDNRRYIPPDQLHWDPARVGAYVYSSQDQGATFSPLAKVEIPDPQFDEHMVVERKDGSLWLLARNQKGMAESSSFDDGRTWTEAKAASIPHIASRFFIRRLLSGRLLLVKHNPHLDTVWLSGKPVSNAWLQRSYLTAYLSDDDGKTWFGGLVLDERIAVSYPDGVQAPDGRIFVIYDYNRKTDKEILLSVFTEEDVLAGHPVSTADLFKVLVNKATGGK